MKLAYVSLPGRGATDRYIAGLAGALQERGWRLCGAVQTDPGRHLAHPCDMDLQVLPRGPVLRISQALGQGARGCRLDGAVIEAAALHAFDGLAGADMLIVNKFGKLEAQGRGFVPLIADAVARDLPVLVGVNALNLPGFLEFAAGAAIRLDGGPDSVMSWLGERVPA